MNDQPSKLADAIVIAKETRRIVQQNIVFILAVKAIVLLLGAAQLTGNLFGRLLIVSGKHDNIPYT